jgi:ATP-binding cassette subfamily B protein
MGMGFGGSPWRRDASVLQEELPKGILRRMARFAAPHRRMILVFLGIICLDAAVSNVNPLLFRTIVDNITAKVGGHDTSLIVRLAGLAALFSVTDALLTLCQTYVSARIGQSVLFDMRTRVFAHVQRMPIAFFTRTQTGALVSRLNNDVNGAQQAFTNTLGSIVSNVINLAIVLVLMFVLSWRITLVLLVLFPLFIIPGRWVGKRLQAIARENYTLQADMNTTMTERFNVSGALLVKLFGKPGFERSEFDEKAGRVRDIGVTQAVYGRIFFLSMMLVTSLATATVYGWGGVLSAHGSLSAGTLVALISYLSRLYGPITQLSNVQVDVMTALVSFDRVFEVLDLPPMIDEQPDAMAIPAGAARIEFEHVDFRYPTADEVSLASLESVAVLDQTPNQQVLFDVSFTVEPGQLVALVGPSGAGKTTISHLVPRLYDVRAGSIRVNGVDVRDASLQSLRDTIGVVTQDAHLFHDTIRANLRYAKPDASDDEMLEVLRAAQILPLVRSLPEGLDTIVGDRGYRFSGGEKQRMAIARLLLKAPRVVVLDEATAHLDSESEALVQEALATALAGRTSIVIAHRLSTVRDADKLLVVSGGRIVEEGTHEQLLERGGLYADLYETQFKGQAEPFAAVAAVAGPGARDEGGERE